MMRLVALDDEEGATPSNCWADIRVRINPALNGDVVFIVDDWGNFKGAIISNCTPAAPSQKEPG